MAKQAAQNKPMPTPIGGKGKSVFDMLNTIKATEHNDGSIKVPVADLQADPNQPRKEFDADRLDNLAASIKEHGIIQPLTVRRTGGIPPYQIIAGERRWRAAQLAGLDQVPVFVRDDLSDDDEKRGVVQLIENTNRADLSDYELAKFIQHLIDTSPDPNRFGLKADIARQLDRKKNDISRLLQMLDTEWLPLVEEGLIVSADALSRFRSCDAELRDRLITAARESGEPVTSGMIRAMKALPAAAAPAIEQSAVGVPGQAFASQNGEEGSGNAGDSGDSAAASLHGSSTSTEGEEGQVWPPSGDGVTYDDDHEGDDAGSQSHASTSAPKGSSAGGGQARNKAVSLNVTGELVEELLGCLVDKSTDKLEVRIPNDLAIAVIENLDGTLPDNPDDYAQTIKDLLRRKLGMN